MSEKTASSPLSRLITIYTEIRLNQLHGAFRTTTHWAKFISKFSHKHPPLLKPSQLATDNHPNHLNWPSKTAIHLAKIYQTPLKLPTIAPFTTNLMHYESTTTQNSRPTNEQTERPSNRPSLTYCKLNFSFV